MSLESALTECTNAIRDLIAVFGAAAKNLGAPATEASAAAPAAEAPAAVTAVTEPARQRREKRMTDGEKAAAALAGTPADPANYEYERDVKPLLQQMVAEMGREAVTALNAQFGVARAQDLPKAALPKVIELAKAKLDAHRSKATDDDGDEESVV